MTAKGGRAEVVHRCPRFGSGITPCCERTPWELPRTDRMTLDPALVTCKPAAQRESEREGAEPHRYRGGVNGCAVCGGGLGEPEHWLGEPGRSPQSSVEAPPSPPSTGQSREPELAAALIRHASYYHALASLQGGHKAEKFEDCGEGPCAAARRALESKP
jgi:hypothetical protein